MKRKLILLLAMCLAVSVGAVAQDTQEQTEKTDAEQKAAASQGDVAAAQSEQSSEAAPLIWVFRHRRVKQCDNTEMTLEESRAKLTEAGLAVHQSSCGFRTDVVYVSGCGEPNGQILLHLIRGNVLDTALEEGYGPAEQIKYQKLNCPKKKP